jgi:hypothetical protein
LPAKTRKSTKNGNGTNASANENFAAALTEVSDRLTRLVQDEIELAKTEVVQKASSLARGAAAVAAGAVFGVFAVVFFLLTLAWVLDGIFVSGAGSLWLGFLIVLVILLILTVGAFLFAWKKLKVGAPTPKMAIDEGKKIKDTVTHFGNGNGNGNGNGHATPDRFAEIVSTAAGASSLGASTPIAETPELSPVPASTASSSASATPAATPVSAPAEQGDSVLGGALPVAPEPAAVEPAPASARAGAPPTLIDLSAARAEEPTFVVEPIEDRAEGAESSPSTGPEN